MPGPWEQFQQSAPAQETAPTQGPWSKFSAPAEQPKANDYEPIIQKASEQYGVPAELIRAVVSKESSGNPNARSKKGAGGLMQLMPSTAADLGVTDVYDPQQNIDGGTKYLKQMLDRYNGDDQKALAAYNWGPGNVDKFGDNYAKVAPKETKDYVRKITAQMGINKPTGKAGDTTTAQDVARGAAGIYRGLFNDVNDAGAQVVGAVLPEGVQRFMDVQGKTMGERVADSEAAYQAKRDELGGGGGIDLGRLAGNIANPTSLALGAGGGTGAIAGRMLPEAFAKLPPTLQKVLAPMLRGGGAAAMMPTSGPGDVLEQKAKQVGIGAALGPVAEGAGRLVNKVVGRGIGALQNQMQPGPAAAQKLGDELGVGLTAGDLAPQNKMLTGIEGALENQRLPFASMAPARQVQQDQAQKAAQQLVDEQHKALVNTSYMDADKLRKLAAGNSVRSPEAKKVLQMIDEAGPDERAIMQASGNNRWLTMKLIADKRFDKVTQLAGETPVPPTQTLEAIDHALAQAGKVVDLDPASMAQLRKWKMQLENPTAQSLDDPIESAVNQMEGNAPGGEVIPNTYGRMRQFRSDLRKRIDSATTNETTDSSKLFLKNIAAGVENDLDNFASSTPGLKDANQQAQDFYRRQVIPYQKQKLASALTGDDPDQIYGAFIRSQAEGRGDYAAKRLFDALDGKGKQAVRYGIVKQAMANATDGDTFSPSAFKKAIESTEYKTYFKDAAARNRVDKVIELFGHLRHADPEHLRKYSPMLGGTMGLGGTGVAGAAAGIAVGNPMAAAVAIGGGIGSAKLLRWLMTSEPGKRMLLSQNVFAKGGSKEGAGKLLEELARRFSSSAGTVSGAENGQPGRVLP